MSSSTRLDVAVTSVPPEEDTAAQENYSKLHFIYWKAAPAFLRLVFQDLWKCHAKYPWKDNRSFGAKLVESLTGNPIMGLWKKFQKDCVRSGNSYQWDLPLLLDIIKNLTPHLKHRDLPQTFNLREMTTKNFDFLKSTRNKLAHAGEDTLDEITFKTLWDETFGILTSMGMAPDLLEKRKKPDSEEKTSTKTTESEEKANALRLAGDDLFEKKSFAHAAAEYSKAISIENIPHELLGLLYSSRSAAKLSQKDLSGAKDDAKSSITLRPQWPQGYTRLGKAYEELRRFDKAALNLRIAIRLGDSSNSTADNFHYCKMMEEKRKCHQHTDIDTLRDRCLTGNQDLVALQNCLKGTTHDFMAKGQHYYWGTNGCPVDYERAAEFFSRAADMGSAWGLVHLADLTMEGKGVEKNPRKGFELFLKAADQPPITEWVKGVTKINLGVKEACMAVALHYDSGFVVEFNKEKALEYYHKALLSGEASAANNIALLKDILVGMEYMKLAAHLGLTRSVESVAENFLQIRHFLYAQQFYHFAMHKGSIVMKDRRAEFVRDRAVEKEFDPQRFAALLEGDVRASRVVGHLLVQIEEFTRKYGVGEDEGKRKKNWGAAVQIQNVENKVAGRPGAILKHRQALRKNYEDSKKNGGWRKDDSKYSKSADAFLVSSASLDFVGIKEIFFKEMEDQKEETVVYTGRFLELSVLEDAIVGPSSIQLLVEDDNGDVGRMFVHNYSQRWKETHAEVGFGCRLSLFYPQFQTMDDGLKAIRVDDPDLICKRKALRNADRCRYCGKTGEKKVVCKKCRRVVYCSKLCAQKDAEELQHSLVCLKTIA